MSSDDSAQEDDRIVYHVQSLEWRADWVTDYLEIVDRDRNYGTAYGSIRPGNQPRARKRGLLATEGRESRRVPVPGLPVNYYDPVWYAELSSKDRADLCATAPEKVQRLMYRGR